MRPLIRVIFASWAAHLDILEGHVVDDVRLFMFRGISRFSQRAALIHDLQDGSEGNAQGPHTARVSRPQSRFRRGK